ncbi:hypothetical protein E2562_024537 [Oryza meyeriana var. granulata]|uniref:Uncharacterized protein n=1 Tax=Oryza meyeriana var. granulata TaxID=110450 RepID=A0A6G1BN83_9ORYZ|nr:hypothetical protein E2562_024537 [Oryza meyeriana var. granulata]
MWKSQRAREKYVDKCKTSGRRVTDAADVRRVASKGRVRSWGGAAAKTKRARARYVAVENGRCPAAS